MYIIPKEQDGQRQVSEKSPLKTPVCLHDSGIGFFRKDSISCETEGVIILISFEGGPLRGLKITQNNEISIKTVRIFFENESRRLLFNNLVVNLLLNSHSDGFCHTRFFHRKVTK